ncbi:MAG: undecaprenyldiphospho-muramoylpentapeptide beta-N-acetylglucosaminyltransferase [Candidatus Rokuibacteriota bacterium]|nr:MAG: undecaprenyldiphospho-muramoylpentapeptide beta-N-acetylglucosaminyltransferase [Candidatus Rokubacteria bacterium]
MDARPERPADASHTGRARRGRVRSTGEPDRRSPLRVVLTGGGTGGHTSAGLALATALRTRLGDQVALAWIGSHGGLEAMQAPAAGIPYYPISTGKLRRQLALRNVTDLALRVPAGLVQAWRLLGRLRPDVVVATGGFVAVPTAVAAALRRRPLLVHEQVVVPGLANRAIARLADRVAVSFAAASVAFPAAKVVVTGNPIRPELLGGRRETGFTRFGLDPATPLLYVTGGAQGAHRLNRVVGAALPGLLAECQVVHQSGDNAFGDPDWLAGQAALLPPALRRRYRVVPFVTDALPDLYAATSLVVGRAGAGTVTELAALGLPAILVPLPGARGDEQTANARVLADAGAALLLPESALAPEPLVALVRELVHDPDRLAEMSRRARTLARSDAATRLVDLILVLAARLG